MNQIIRLFGALALLILSPVFVYAQEPPENNSNEKSASRGGIVEHLLRENKSSFDLYPYEDNYFLFTKTSGINREAIADQSWAARTRDTEVKFQISLALPLSRGLAGDNSVLGVSYTQYSWWQVFNDDISSPFRETNYEPQLFLAWATDRVIGGGWSLEEVELGLNHHSNGRSNSASRGWNRGYLRLMAQKDNWQVDLKPWFLIGESTPVNNPEIFKYIGHYRLKVGYRLGNNIFSVKSHYNWHSGYGGTELSWSYPISSNTRCYTQLFSGYGESLIDYDYNQTRFGIGLVMDKPW